MLKQLFKNLLKKDDGHGALLVRFEALEKKYALLEKKYASLEEKCAKLEKENAALKQENAALKLENTELKSKIALLEAKINTNSKNSSMPPSSNIFGKPNPKSLREKSGKKPGAQKKHKGHTLKQIEKPDEINEIKIKVCSGCNASLENISAQSFEKRQVFDLPQPKVHVIEHRCEIKKCITCGKVNVAKFPKDVMAPVQYGVNIKSMVAYFQNQQMLPFGRLVETFKDLFGLPISEGFVFNTAKSAYKKLENFESETKKALLNSKVLHVDETGFKVGDSSYWLHSASTGKLTNYSVHKNRGPIAMEAAGILPDFTGVMVHDFWSPYYNFDKADHAACGPHLLRELKSVIENAKHFWAEQMSDFLYKCHNHVKAKNNYTVSSFKKILSQYRKVLVAGSREIAASTDPPDSLKKSKNLLKRFQDYETEILRFACEANVPFSNNLAERDIRMVKVKQKVSGRFRSISGAEYFARTRSYISTCRKQGLNVFDELKNIFEGQPFIPTVGIPE